MADRRRCIVLVEDDPSVQKMTVVRLEHEGFDVVVASDGEEALAVIAAQIPDLVLLDIQLPKLNGFDVCARLRQDPQTATLPIIVFTAFDVHQRMLAARSTELGIAEWLRKPFRSDDLMACIHKVLHDPSRNQGDMRS